MKRRYKKDQENSLWVLFEKDSRDVVGEKRVKEAKGQILVYHLK